MKRIAPKNVTCGWAWNRFVDAAADQYYYDDNPAELPAWMCWLGVRWAGLRLDFWGLFWKWKEQP